MPRARPKKPPPSPKPRWRRRLGWREIRISYLTLKVWGVILLLLAGAAVGSVAWNRYRGTESFVARVFSVARRKVDQRLQMLGTSGTPEEPLEQRYASLSFFSGSVKIQRATELGWQDAQENMRLSAGDRVRTFSSARAEVSFDDGNVLRIKPDSLIVIGDLTENLRTKVKKSSVRLLVSSIEADIKKSVVRGSQFKLELPTAVAEVEKARLSVEIRPDRQSQVRVYSGAVSIDTGQDRVQLGDRKAVTISAGKQITAPENLLPAPRLHAPRPLDDFYTATGGAIISCAWDPVAGARSYRLEVASDRFFDRTVVTRDDLRSTQVETPALGAGIYYVRAAGVDLSGRAGDFSAPVPVRVVLDRQPPFLEVQKFVVLRTARGREILINGRTEPRATVEVGGREVAVDDSGYFSAVLRNLRAGESEVEIRARDRAGNVKTLRQPVQT